MARVGQKASGVRQHSDKVPKAAFMLFAAKEYNRRNWVMQLHYGCKRDNNAYMYQQHLPEKSSARSSPPYGH